MTAERVALAALRDEGLAAYSILQTALSDEHATERWLSQFTDMEGSVDQSRRAAASLPPPHPTFPLGLLAAVAQSARSGALEAFYTMDIEGKEALATRPSQPFATVAELGSRPATEPLRSWFERHSVDLEVLRAPGQFAISEFPWDGWMSSVGQKPFDSGPFDWGVFRSAMERSLADDPKLEDLQWLGALVLVRDWSFDVEALTAETDTGLDDLVEALTATGPGSQLPKVSAEPTDTDRLDAFLQLLKYNDRSFISQPHNVPTSSWTLLAMYCGVGDISVIVHLLADVLPATAVEAALERARSSQPSSRPSAAITRDFWTVDDSLGYDLYADAIVAFLEHQDTAPPLTIGVKGPWGSGKTSLMRMVRQRLDPDPESKIHLKRAPNATNDANPTNDATEGLTIKSALEVGREANPDENMPVVATLPRQTARPTVWFNAWMYQSGEQVWAGLANAIIDQVSARLPRAEREEFWLRLNLARVDGSEVRRRIYRVAFEKAAPIVLLVVAFLVLAIGLALVAPLWPTVATYIRAVSGLSLVAAVPGGTLFGWKRWNSYLGEDASKAVADLVREPDYDTRLGFLHLVQNDMRRVLDLVADEQRPIVVFVDDLDRCSQASVVQVIEAINLFLAGQFPNCVFVLAMEPDIVAAHIEVAYEKVVSVLREDDAVEWSALGWRFLEKMVQLPLSLPVSTPDQVDRYLDSVLATGPPPKQQLDESRVDAIRDAIVRRGVNVSHPYETAIAVQRDLVPTAEPTRLSNEAVAAAELAFADAFRDEAHGVKSLIAQYVGWLSSNPREIKRFINLFRFYSFIQVRRQLRGLEAPTLEQIGKISVLAIRWPQLATRLMTHTEDEVSILVRLEAVVREGAANGSGDGHSSWNEQLEAVELTDWQDLVSAKDFALFLQSDPLIGHAPRIV